MQIRGGSPFFMQKFKGGSQENMQMYKQCKMGLTGLHDSPARVQNSLFIVWLSRVCL